MKSNKKLVENLKNALEVLKKMDHTTGTISRYESAEELAVFIESQIVSLADGTMTDKNLKELWVIFAPTSDWDDYTKNIELGDSIFQELNSFRGKNKKVENITDKQLNYIFILSVVFCFISAFFITLYYGENTVISYASPSANNNAADDSSNLLFATFLFLPFVISRFFLRRNLMSLIEIFYFPLALVVTIVSVELSSNFPLMITIPSTIRHGTLIDAVLLLLYLISYTGFIFSYFVQLFRQSKRLWAMYTEQ